MFTDIRLRDRILTTIALGTGTILLSFSVTLNIHTITAALLLAAVRRAMAGNGIRAGAWVALAVCIDTVPGLVFAPVLGLILWDTASRRGLGGYGLCLGLGFAMFVLTNLWIVGVVLAVSILFEAIGAYHPWPPAYEQEANKHPIASIVTNPIGGNLSA